MNRILRTMEAVSDAAVAAGASMVITFAAHWLIEDSQRPEPTYVTPSDEVAMTAQNAYSQLHAQPVQNEDPIMADDVDGVQEGLAITGIGTMAEICCWGLRRRVIQRTRKLAVKH